MSLNSICALAGCAISYFVDDPKCSFTRLLVKYDLCMASFDIVRVLMTEHLDRFRLVRSG